MLGARFFLGSSLLFAMAIAAVAAHPMGGKGKPLVYVLAHQASTPSSEASTPPDLGQREKELFAALRRYCARPDAQHFNQDVCARLETLWVDARQQEILKRADSIVDLLKSSFRLFAPKEMIELLAQNPEADLETVRQIIRLVRDSMPHVFDKDEQSDVHYARLIDALKEKEWVLSEDRLLRQRLNEARQRFSATMTGNTPDNVTASFEARLTEWAERETHRILTVVTLLRLFRSAEKGDAEQMDTLDEEVRAVLADLRHEDRGLVLGHIGYHLLTSYVTLDSARREGEDEPQNSLMTLISKRKETIARVMKQHDDFLKETPSSVDASDDGVAFIPPRPLDLTLCGEKDKRMIVFKVLKKFVKSAAATELDPAELQNAILNGLSENASFDAFADFGFPTHPLAGIYLLILEYFAPFATNEPTSYADADALLRDADEGRWASAFSREDLAYELSKGEQQYAFTADVFAFRHSFRNVALSLRAVKAFELALNSGASFSRAAAARYLDFMTAILEYDTSGDKQRLINGGRQIKLERYIDFFREIAAFMRTLADYPETDKLLDHLDLALDIYAP